MSTAVYGHDGTFLQSPRGVEAESMEAIRPHAIRQFNTLSDKKIETFRPAGEHCFLNIHLYVSLTLSQCCELSVPMTPSIHWPPLPVITVLVLQLSFETGKRNSVTMKSDRREGKNRPSCLPMCLSRLADGTLRQVIPVNRNVGDDRDVSYVIRRRCGSVKASKVFLTVYHASHGAIYTSLPSS